MGLGEQPAVVRRRFFGSWNENEQEKDYEKDED
jgi:hypothetical protein